VEARRARAGRGTAGSPGGFAAARAHHLEQCAQPGDREAIAVLATAAGEVVGRAPVAAARWWAAALRLLPDRAPDEERVELLVPMATALGAAGELAAARDALHEVLGLAEDAELRGRLVAFIALIEQLLGHRETAQALLAETLGAAGPRLADRDRSGSSLPTSATSRPTGRACACTPPRRCGRRGRSRTTR